MFESNQTQNIKGKRTYRGRRHRPIEFQSLKLARPVFVDSHLEYLFAIWLEYEKTVDSYQEQPFQIQYEDNGKQRHYTPDFLVRGHQGDYVVEVKLQKYVWTEKTQKLAKIGGDWCFERGMLYTVYTDRELHTVRMQNISKLFMFGKNQNFFEMFGAVMIDEITNYVATASYPTTFNSAALALMPDEPHRIFSAIAYCGFHHYIEVDIDSGHISGETVISVNPEFQEAENHDSPTV